MSLIDRLRGFDDAGSRVADKMPVHQFTYALSDYAISGAGNMTEDDIKNQWGLTSGSDLSEWVWLRDAYNSSADKPLFREAMRNIFGLIEQNIKYTTKAAIQARINGLG